jgi:hypothetical protein
MRVMVMAPLWRLTEVRAFVLHSVGTRYAWRGVAARHGRRGGGQVRVCVHNPLPSSPRGWTRGGVRFCIATATSPAAAAAAAAAPAMRRALGKPVVSDFFSLILLE